MDKEKETKRDYESPSTEKTTVEMQGYLCGSIETNTEGKEVKINAQDVVDSGANNFEEKEWGTLPTEP